MMKNIKQIFVLLFILSINAIYAQDSKPLIYKINIKENIGSNTWVYLQNGMHQALNKNADCLLIHMNTWRLCCRSRFHAYCHSEFSASGVCFH